MKLNIILSIFALLIAIYGIITTVNIAQYKKEVTEIGQRNDSLLKVNINIQKIDDSLILSVNKSDSEINEYLSDILMQDSVIGTLKVKENEIHSFVNDLNANGVAQQLTNYLQRRSKTTNNAPKGHFDSYECAGCKGNP